MTHNSIKRGYWDSLKEILIYPDLCWPTYLQGLINNLRAIEIARCCYHSKECSTCSVNWKLLGVGK